MKQFHINNRDYIIYDLGIFASSRYDINTSRQYIYLDYVHYYREKSVLLFFNLMERKI